MIWWCVRYRQVNYSRSKLRKHSAEKSEVYQMKKMQQTKQYGRRICKILVPGDWVKSCSSMIFFSVFILVGVWQQYLRSCSWPVRPRAVGPCATAADDQTGWSIGLWTSTAGEPGHLYWPRVYLTVNRHCRWTCSPVLATCTWLWDSTVSLPPTAAATKHQVQTTNRARSGTFSDKCSLQWPAYILHQRVYSHRRRSCVILLIYCFRTWQ